MRISIHWLLILLVPLIAGCSGGDKSSRALPPKTDLPPPLIRVYFAGTTRLATDTNAAPWVSMAELPESQALWRQTLEKLAQTAQLAFRRTAATNPTNNYVSVFQEMFADFVRAESFVEITGDSNRISEYELALRLPVDRAEFWQTNLLAILEKWTGLHSERLSVGATGWQLGFKQRDYDPNLFRLVRVGEWIVFGCGQGELRIQEELIKQIKHTGNLASLQSNQIPGAIIVTSWLEVFLDFPNMPRVLVTPPSSGAKREFSMVIPKATPAVNFHLTGRGNNLDIKGALTFRKPFSLKPEPWQIPTNLVRDPIISFTAVRGVEPMLKNQQEDFGLRFDSIPNQLFVWSGTGPFQTLAAVPVSGDASGYLRDLGSQLITRFNPELRARNVGSFELGTNLDGTTAFAWTGIPPFVTPFISTAQDAGRDFLLAGVHPIWGGNDPPPVLFQYLAGQTNLVYYDWEITAQHIWTLRHIVNIFRHFFEQPRLGPNSASIMWINSVSNQLGNTVTEIRSMDSNRLAFVRQGPVGLTGLELIALAHWLESPDFPLTGFTLDPQTNAVAAP